MKELTTQGLVQKMYTLVKDGGVNVNTRDDYSQVEELHTLQLELGKRLVEVARNHIEKGE